MVYTSFWESIGEFFKKIGDNLYEFWISPKTNEDGTSEFPYLATFLFAILFLIFALIFIKILIVCLKKAFKVNKKSLVKTRTLKLFLINTLKTVLWILTFVCFLSILGVELSGISEIFSSAILAIGLSLQDVVSNFASGLILLTVKQFEVGDYIKIKNDYDAVEGSVIDVQMLNTFLKTVDGQIIIVQNKNVTSAIITNYSTNPIRRLVLDCKVPFDSDVEKIKGILLDIAKDDKRVLIDPAPSCVLSSFNDSSITISLRMFVPNSAYWDMLFNFNETVHSYFIENNIHFAIQKIELVGDEKKE